ncbi:hypothetical protein PAXRUDRAFT_829029 [Paxillus rubicundulus Ve08.2h10]|uniref:WD40 repeat-like protein n=1 Tax=Paxillus rubicundulus Ve08.2h10 TaxID=930991 RepID=A0A0D0DVC6_9AGAM|nr:hypothetical protein PAXRUDRAFT_829029 [Paxillus rubicundulus Ve08.2h10]
MFFDPIQQAALQVYYTIPYAPKHVQLRTTYQRELANKFTITSGLDDLWSPCVRSVLAGNAIKSLAVSASGRLIASAGGTPGVQMWDLLTGRNVGHFTGGGISSLCPVMFSPSGDYVAVGYDTGEMNVWDVATGQQLFDPNQGTHQAPVTVLAFSWNSFFVASGSTDATVYIWDISTRSLRHSLAYHEGPVRCLLFSFNDSLIASGSDDALVITSNIKSGQQVRKMKGHSAKINSISFSTDSSSIASGSDDQAVRLWDIRTGVCLRTYTGSHKKPVKHVWITTDNKFLVSVCDMNIYMWKLGSRKSPQHIWSVDHFFQRLAIMFPAWYAKLVRLFPPKLVGRFLETDDGTPLCPVFSPNRDVLGFIYQSFCFSLDYSVITQRQSRIRNPLTSSPTLDETPLLPGESSEPFTAIAMAPDSTQLITFDGSAIQIWNTTLPRTSWKDIEVNMKKSVEGFWPAPDGRSLLVKQFIGLSLFTSAGTLIKEPETGGDNLGKVGASVSPNSKYYAYWAEYTWNIDQSFSIHIYETATGVRLKRLPGLFKIECVTFSAESEFVACGHGDGIIQVWDLPSGLCKANINTGHAAITSLAFIPGNTTLISGSEEGYVEIRLVENGDNLHQVQCATAKVSALAITTESSLIVVGHADGSLYLWDPPAAKVNLHCLSPKDTSDSTSLDGVDLIKFTDNCRSINSRSKKGIISTWDLSPCLAEYGEGGKKVLLKAVDGRAPGSGIPALPDNLSNSNSSDESAALDALDATPAGRAESGSTLSESSASECAEFQSKAFESTTTTDGSAPPIISTSPCPHLLSRSDSNIVYDMYLSSTYSVNCQEGWVYRGSRRMMWLPDEFRPASPTSFSAIDDRLVIFTKTGTRLVFFDLRSMVGTIPRSWPRP